MKALAAANEAGPVAVQVWCATCRGKTPKPLGEVRRSSAGLVFDARLPGAVTFPPGQREAILERFRARGARRLPLPVAVGRCVVLLEVDDPDAEVPAVECRGHRVELDPAELITAAGRQTQLRRPAKVTITHPTGQRSVTLS